MNFKAKALFLLLIASTATTAGASAQTVTVTTAADAVDINWQTATIADLPGPDGVVSLSEALIATNNTPGHQTIGFAVPSGGWLLQFLFPGRVVFTSITGFYWRANDEVTIDGTTQTAFTGDTNPDGAEIVIYGDELYLNVPNCTLIGIDSSAVFLGGDSLVQGNTGNMNITVGGSGTWIEGNSGGTLGLSGNDHVVVGNTFSRLRLLSGNNNVIGGPDPEDRNFITGYGTWNISSGLPSGTTMQVSNTVGTVIENNYIGTTPDGLAQGNPASTIGISFEGSNHDVVVRDNLIAGIHAVGIGTWAGYHFGYAVLFWGSGGGSNIELTGNTIGLDANGDPTLGSVWGINVGNVNGAGTYTDLRIGGAGPGEGNTVAGHTLSGIVVGRLAADVRVSENSVYGNGGLGLDLVETGFTTGVTPNDPLDLDTGGNGLQNFPDLTSATVQGTTVHVVGALHSSPLDDFTVELFASAECDPTGFGEGELFLGRVSVSTDGGGDADLDAQLAAAVPAGWFVTATATLEPGGATSEFGGCVELTGQGVQSYCTAGTTASGCQVALSASGVPSATAPSGFLVSAADVEGSKDGTFFFGSSGRQANPWGNGTSYQCVVPPVTRAGLLSGTGTGGQCDGSFSQDFNALWTAKPAKNPGAGAVAQVQLWFRDPLNPSNQTTSLSDAIEFTLLP